MSSFECDPADGEYRVEVLENRRLADETTTGYSTVLFKRTTACDDWTFVAVRTWRFHDAITQNDAWMAASEAAGMLSCIFHAELDEEAM